jgi:hypothetical protein
MRAGDLAIKIGYGGDHRRALLGWRPVVRTIVAARMIPQGPGVVDHLDAAQSQVGLDRRPADRLRHGDQTPCRFRRSGADGCANARRGLARFELRQAQKAPRLLGDVAKVDEAAALTDDVEEVAIFGRGRIGPMTGSTGAGVRPAEPDEHRPAGRVAYIPHGPVATLAPAVGQIVATDRLGIAGEAARQFGSVAGHHEIPRHELTLCCVDPGDRPQDKAKSRMRNITRAATCSVLCAVEHKTDAATGEHGDLLDVIRESCGLVDFHDVTEEARRFLSLPRSEQESEISSRRPPVPTGSPESARRLFAMAKPIAGTVVETYLRGRGITDLHGVDSLRPHPRCYYRPDADAPTEIWPAMIAAVSDLQGRITGAHRTWLDPSGRDKALVDTPRRAMGHLLGNAVRFGPASDVMAAGEGIETMLSLRCVMPTMAMVAALSAAHLAAILFPAALRRLYIVRDDDPGGDGAMNRLMDRAQMAAVEAIALSPQCGDFNEDLRNFDINALRAALRFQLTPEDVVRFLSTSVRTSIGDEVSTRP